MNYQKIYNSIINRAIGRVNNYYVEKHHIVPKFMGGTNESSNIVKLLPREHYLCHVLLTKIVPENKKYAAVKSCYMMLTWSYSNENRISIKPGVSKRVIRKIPPMPESTREKLSIATTKQFQDKELRSRHLEGVKTRFLDPREHQKLSDGQNLRYKDPLEKTKISNGLLRFFETNVSPNKGRSFAHLTIEERKKTFGRPRKKGVKRSAETIQKMKDAWIKRKSVDK